MKYLALRSTIVRELIVRSFGVQDYRPETSAHNIFCAGLGNPNLSEFYDRLNAGIQAESAILNRIAMSLR